MSSSTNICDGCGCGFPLRQDNQLCCKCEKLKPHPIGSESYNDISQWPQCVSCGVTRRNNMPAPNQGEAQTCGSVACSKEIQGAGYRPTPSQSNIPESHLDRALHTSNRFNKGRTMAQKPGPGTLFTTSSLLNHEHGGGAPGEDKIMVAWQVRESKAKAVNTDLGSSAKKWAVSTPMPDVKASLVESLNVEWCRSHSAPLLAEEVTFRWHGSLLLDPNTANMTVRDFYAYYSAPSRASIFMSSVPTMWKGMAKTNRAAIYLELYIDVSAFHLRSSGEDDSSSALVSSRRKRALSSTSEGANRDYEATKRRNPSMGPLKSMFVPTSSSAIVVHKVSPVTLKKTICTADNITGVPEFEEAEIEVSGVIRDTHFAKGAMKYAFEFKTSHGEALVAKRFYRLEETDSPSSSVAVLDNKEEIILELRRLTLGAHLLKEFYKHAKHKGVDVYTAIEFATAWLGQEVQESPSKASETREIDSSHEGITWLVEKKRAKIVEHFTFTLNHQTRRQDFCAKTIHAFAHFVYGNSQRSVVFADIQGTPAHVNSRDVMVLFDPMTHTPAGDSGIGDFGSEGIETFLKDHICGDICVALNLDKEVPLDAVEQPNENDDDVPSTP
ncbi:kinase-like domain-containing protein [Favolaschia claudopus]|uniref:Kinase-like domain-containing protein n=1 Tax=Favolaschia claudopus TaxID=2862362 RepID=A0AAW0E1Z0_9AGAR